MTDKPTKKRLILDAEAVLKMAGVENPHQLAVKARVSAPTVNRWIGDPNNLKLLYLDTFATVMLDGCGLTPKQLLDMPLGKIFKIGDVENGNTTTNSAETKSKRKT